MWEDAAEIAIKAKDADKCEIVKANCDAIDLIQKLDDALARKFR